MNEDAKRWIYWTIPVVVVIGLLAALYYGRQHRQAEVEPETAAGPTPPAAAPPIRHPLSEDVERSEPLPPLAQSDSAVRHSLDGVFGRTLEPFLVPQNIVRNTVVTIDNLPRKKLAVQMRPLRPTPGELATSEPSASSSAEPLTLSRANYARYAALVRVVEGADIAQVVALYKRYYPLFQQAYVDLGYPDGYFNDRLVEVIDHLLATPEVSGPIKLTRPSVYYEFADPSLESRSAGQKLLIRMGNENAAKIKAKLRELRQAVTEQPVSERGATSQPTIQGATQRPIPGSTPETTQGPGSSQDGTEDAAIGGDPVGSEQGTSNSSKAGSTREPGTNP